MFAQGMRKRAVIMGAGHMGKKHATCYARMDGAELAGVIDADEKRARAFAAEFGCAVYSDVAQAALEANFADICLPTKLHEKTAAVCMDLGLDVICEKPIALEVGEAERMMAKADETSRRLMIAHVVRFWPEYNKLSQMVQAGEVGRIHYITLSRYGAPPNWSVGNWMLADRESGGIIFDLCIHDIDFCLSLLGAPDWVFARSCQMDGYTAYVNALLGYPGTNVLLEGGFIMPVAYPFTTGFRIGGDRCALEYVNKSRQGLLRYGPDGEGPVQVEHEDYDPYQRELEYFVECLVDGRAPAEGSPAASLMALKVAKCIEKSAYTGEKVLVRA